jgi:hypothetical protein
MAWLRSPTAAAGRRRCSSFLALGSARRCETGTDGSTLRGERQWEPRRSATGQAHSGLGDQATTMDVRKVGRALGAEGAMGRRRESE